MIEIRPYSPEDIPACRELFLQLIQSAGGHKTVDRFVRKYVKEFDNIDQHFCWAGPSQPPEQVKVLWVAHEVDDAAPGRVLGIVGLKKTDDVTVVELVRLSVDQAARRKGVARLLMAHVEDFASKHGFHQIVLRTLSPLGPALELYTALGYSKDKVETIGPNIDLIEMSKPLKRNE